jgi:hypothetical protein
MNDIKDIIICDLDGTLANCEHRRHYVENKPKNWDAFYAGVSDDIVDDTVLTLLRDLDRYVVFCTGRPERCRVDTDAWIGEHYGRVRRYELLMRQDGDYRADYIVKQELLDNHIDKDRVLFVLDDRQQVVDMWRRNGLVCLQVAPGNF